MYLRVDLFAAAGDFIVRNWDEKSSSEGISSRGGTDRTPMTGRVLRHAMSILAAWRQRLWVARYRSQL